MAESRYIKCTIDNQTTTYWTIQEYSLEQGKWKDGNTPDNIVPNSDSLNFYASGRSNTPSGTEGSITWKSDQHDATLNVYFKCPYGMDASTLKITITGDGASFYNYSQANFHPENKGHNPTITIISV